MIESTVTTGRKATNRRYLECNYYMSSTQHKNHVTELPKLYNLKNITTLSLSGRANRSCLREKFIHSQTTRETDAKNRYDAQRESAVASVQVTSKPLQ